MDDENKVVLLIEDNPGDARLIREMLNAGVFTLLHRDSLAAGLSAIKKEEPDLVLVDLSLPDSAGLETLESVLRVSSAPVIVLTGNTDRETGLKAVQRGAQDYLVKGEVDEELLQRTLLYSIERYQMVRELREKTRGLEESESRFRKLVETMADGIMVLSEGGKVLFTNPALEKILGKKAEKLRAQIFGFELKDGQVHEIDVIRGEEGKGVAEMRVVETEWGGEKSYLASLRDVTQMKRTQEELRELNERLTIANRTLQEAQASVVQTERLAAVGQLAAGVAHEINNPTAFVLSNFQSLSKCLGTLFESYKRLKISYLGITDIEGAESLKKYEKEHEISFLWQDSSDIMDECLEGIDRVSKIVRDLRVFAGDSSEKSVEVNLNEVVNSTLSMIKNQVSFKATLKTDLGELPAIKGDPGRISQVFLNLVMNAVQALPEGKTSENEIQIRTWSDEYTVHLSVRDTGLGIHTDVLPRVFDPFFTTKPVGEGTGLGLAISYDIIRKHGGHICLENNKDGGTTANVTFPVYPGISEEEGEGMETLRKEPESSKGIRVLLVDDEPHILKSYSRILPDRYEMITAQSGKEALDILRSDPGFDAVLCDVMMPDISGKEVYEQAIEENPNLLDKFIFITGGAFTKQTREFILSMKHACLEKPFKAEEMIEAIDRVSSGGDAETVKSIKDLKRGA